MSTGASGAQHSADRPKGVVREWVTRQRIIAIVLAFDFGALVAIGLLTSLLLLPQSSVFSGTAVSIVLAVTLVAVYVLQRLWGYTIAALGVFPRQVRLLLLALGAGFIAITGTMFLFGVDIMPYRLWLLGWLLGLLVVMPLFRLLVARSIGAAERRGELARRAVIVGGGKPCDDLIGRLDASGNNAIRILGVFDDRDDERSPDTVRGYRKIGAFSELAGYCRENRVDLLVIALPATAEDRILHLMKKLWELPIDVRIAAHASKLKLSKRAYTYIGTVPFLAVFDRPLSDWNATVKWAFDCIVAALVLVAISPVMLLIALAVKFDSKGPALFRQKRHGFNNEIIEVFKFRSMFTDMTDHNAARQVTRGDPRVTRVGRFIRKTSLDELPQLFNVLRGELSLVGPRPHAIETKAGNRLYQEVVDGYYARHRMKPGITGWAQINGWRGETDTVDKIERRVEHDLHYIENWSLPLDIYILVMTPFALLSTRNAY